MSLVLLYDPPGRLNDFDALPGQRLAWRRFVVEQFAAQIDELAQTFGRALNPQFYDASRYDPGGPVVEHLCAPPNSLVAEINLGANSTLIYEDSMKMRTVDPDAFIAATGFDGPNRNSDPTIAATVNALARLGAMITIANPVGLYMDHGGGVGSCAEVLVATE